MCQVLGPAARLPVAALPEILADDGGLHAILNAGVQGTITQLARNVACNRAHRAEQRAARWLLMTGDRVRSDTFLLTQEFLGQMLGVRRATVSEIASQLQSKGLIRYSRGEITIVDRPGLESVACDCYAFVTRELDRLLPPTAR
jgi:CRP-like cAMP-binding protein